MIFFKPQYYCVWHECATVEIPGRLSHCPKCGHDGRTINDLRAMQTIFVHQETERKRQEYAR